MSESKHLLLSNTIKESMSIKLQEGIPIKRIMDGMTFKSIKSILELVTMTRLMYTKSTLLNDMVEP